MAKDKSEIEKQREEAERMWGVTNHLIKLIDSDNERYSFEVATNDKVEIFDKADRIRYTIRIEPTEETEKRTTMLIKTGEYITTADGSMHYYKCAVCGYDEILNEDNYCPRCGRKVID